MKQTNLPGAFKAIFPLLFLFMLNSCLGINADIVFNRNGSGTIALEYHISKSLDSLGKTDGNERWNTIPAGRADFERTLDRLPEIKLLSFSSKEDEKNLIIAVKMEFANLQGLLSFLDASGRRSSLSGDASSGNLVLTLNEGSKNKNTGQGSPPDKLIADIFESYSVRMSMTFPDEGSLNITDNQGNPLNTGAGSEFNTRGKRVSFSFPLYEVLSSSEGINVVFSW